MNDRSGKATPMKRNLKIGYLFDNESDVDGAIESHDSGAYDELTSSRRSDWYSGCSLDESECGSPVADEAGPPLIKLPPGRFRSVGGYFSYEGWPDQQRFMELDEALRRRARENCLSSQSKAQPRRWGKVQPDN